MYIIPNSSIGDSNAESGFETTDLNFNISLKLQISNMTLTITC